MSDSRRDPIGYQPAPSRPNCRCTVSPLLPPHIPGELCRHPDLAEVDALMDDYYEESDS